MVVPTIGPQSHVNTLKLMINWRQFANKELMFDVWQCFGELASTWRSVVTWGRVISLSSRASRM